jgi:chromosome segregation ATPase
MTLSIEHSHHQIIDAQVAEPELSYPTMDTASYTERLRIADEVHETGSTAHETALSSWQQYAEYARNILEPLQAVQVRISEALARQAQARTKYHGFITLANELNERSAELHAAHMDELGRLKSVYSRDVESYGAQIASKKVQEQELLRELGQIEYETTRLTAVVNALSVPDDHDEFAPDPSKDRNAEILRYNLDHNWDADMQSRVVDEPRVLLSQAQIAKRRKSEEFAQISIELDRLKNDLERCGARFALDGEEISARWQQQSVGLQAEVEALVSDIHGAEAQLQECDAEVNLLHERARQIAESVDAMLLTPVQIRALEEMSGLVNLGD